MIEPIITSVALQSAASTSKVATKLAIEALDEYLNDNDDTIEEIMKGSVASVALTSKVATKLAIDTLDEYLNNNEG